MKDENISSNTDDLNSESLSSSKVVSENKEDKFCKISSITLGWLLALSVPLAILEVFLSSVFLYFEGVESDKFIQFYFKYKLGYPIIALILLWYTHIISKRKEYLKSGLIRVSILLTSSILFFILVATSR